jgi:hypothetical protein
MFASPLMANGIYDRPISELPTYALLNAKVDITIASGERGVSLYKANGSRAILGTSELVGGLTFPAGTTFQIKGVYQDYFKTTYNGIYNAEFNWGDCEFKSDFPAPSGSILSELLIVQATHSYLCNYDPSTFSNGGVIGTYELGAVDIVAIDTPDGICQSRTGDYCYIEANYQESPDVLHQRFTGLFVLENAFEIKLP